MTAVNVSYDGTIAPDTGVSIGCQAGCRGAAAACPSRPTARPACSADRTEPHHPGCARGQPPARTSGTPSPRGKAPCP
ncbi:hypothetical protein [Streptomyces nodosus]|uniref:hypothetical protein n=1 Tax=Streptomyces nodosus TaxID=40318 RepID=UPI001F5E7DA2|nr:hypothetical protein [Streptomyces nodosus]